MVQGPRVTNPGTGAAFGASDERKGSNGEGRQTLERSWEGGGEASIGADRASIWPG